MSAIPSRFYALFLRARCAHVVRSALPCVATATVLRHYTALARAPTLGACFVHAQNKRRGLALKVVPGSSWRFSLVLDSSHCVTKATGTTRPTCKYLQVRAVYVLKLGKTWAKFVGPHVVSTASVRIWEHADTP